nr:endoglucanase E-4-like isoform X1 [Cherax quadricarinatus]
MTGVLVKTCLLGALALTLLHSGAEAQCDNVVISSEWQGNYVVDLTTEAPVDIDGLTVELSFSRPVESIEFYAGTATKIDDTHYILNDPTATASAGEELVVSFHVSYTSIMPLVVTETINDVEICDATFTTPTPMENPCAETGMKPYDYSQVLCMSYVFYEAQRSGKLPADQRVTWRGDSALDDGSDVGHDLTGGYYDAGDHVKFGFPMAYTATVLAWGLIDFAEGHEAAGQTEYGRVALKWATDYFLKAHTAKDELYGQVGKGDVDHSYWGRPEIMTMERPSYKIDEAHAGSELAGETAAALAAASIVFKDVDSAYASEMLDVAKELYDFADNFREKYDNSIEDVKAYYQSWSGYGDELCWAALWLARATGDDTYLSRAKGHWEEFDLTSYLASFSWDDKRAGIYSIFWLLTGDTEYSQYLVKFLNYLKTTAPYTPEGLVYLDAWGANRHAANVAFISLWAAKNGFDKEANQEWARSQIGQLLGDNSRYHRSFVVGFGQDPPQRPHHRSSSCPSPPQDCTGALDNPDPSPHVLYGALVGGPAGDGSYTDDRHDYQHNEVACDYNAAFTGALAALVELS